MNEIEGLENQPVDEFREALHESEQRFRILVEGVGEYAIFLLDPTGRIISWNAGAERIKQYSASEIIGQHFSIFYTEAAVAAGKPDWELRTALAEGKVEDESWRVRRDGTRFWGNVVITALFDSQGNHIGFAKVTRDLTDRRREEEAARRFARLQLLESEARFSRFAEHLPGLAWMKDREGRYTYLNNAATTAIGRPLTEILGRTYADLLSNGVPSLTDIERRVFESGTAVESVENVQWRDGEVRHVIVSRFPVTDGEGRIRLLGGIAIDISDRVAAEEQLRHADRRKNEFLATLAHELRNPLAPLRNGIHLLQRNPEPLERQRIQQMLEKQVQHVVRLVDDLLEVSRITTGKVELRCAHIDLREVVQSAVEAASSSIAEQGHSLEVTIPDQPVMVDGDAVRLGQVLANLLNNAIKYTPSGGRIAIMVGDDGAEAVVEVRDSGIGINRQDLDRVFEMFSQLTAASESAPGGLGIGLALARTLVTMHRGSLTADSVGAGEGSTFRVTLPLLPSEDAVAEPVQAVSAAALRRTDPSDQQRPRVLIVDDSRDGADSLAMVLDLIGLDTRVIYEGARALAELIEWQPAVALIDIGMPDMDGYEVARQVRSQPSLAAIRLIALTGWGTSEDRARSREAGFDDHWVKPVDPSQLQALLTED